MNVDATLAMLKKTPVGKLREKYAEVFGEASRSFNKQHLVKRITWRMQSLAEGDLSERARRRAEFLAGDANLRSRPPLELTMPPALAGDQHERPRRCGYESC